MNEQKNTEIVQNAYQTFGEGNIENFLTILSENINWRGPQFDDSPFKSEYNGRADVAAMFATLDDKETISRFEPREFIAQGDRVVVLGSMASTVKETGRDYETDWVHVFTVRDDLITNLLGNFRHRRRCEGFSKSRQCLIKHLAVSF